MDTNSKIKIGLAITGAVLILFIIYKILGKLGLVKDEKREKLNEGANELRSMPEFRPDFHRNKMFAKLGEPVASSYAKEIKKALGIVSDNEEALYSVFSRMKNKTNISEVSDQFQQMYNKDMKGFILNKLNVKEMNKLKTIIQKLPNF